MDIGRAAEVVGCQKRRREGVVSFERIGAGKEG